MARLEVFTHVKAPPEQVWEVLVDWESQPQWMADARSVEVVGNQRTGVGTQLTCRTRLLAGIEFDDRMTVTAWRPPEVLAVRHDGWLLRGAGVFELAPIGQGTRLVWWEAFHAPLGPVGEAVWRLLVQHWVRRVFRRSLVALKGTFEHAPGV